jgi:uncharacterized protein involved in outer membrane biogenesis
VTSSRVLRLVMWAVLALLLTWLVAWLALPPLLKWQLQTRGSALLGRELSVGDVRFVPMTLQLTLRDLALAGAPGDADTTPQLQVDRLFIDLDARTLLRLAPVVAALEVDAPKLRLTRHADGRLDIDDLLQRFASAPDKPAEPDAAPARFALFNLRVADGRMRFDDRTVDRQHLLRELQLALPFLSSLPDDLQVKVEPRLAFEIDGSRFDSHGRSTPFAEGRASQLELRFAALALQPLWAYLPRGLPLQPSGGSLSAELVLNFEQPRAQPPRVQLQGWAELDELQAQPSAQTPLLGFRKLRVELERLHLVQRRLELKSVQIDGAQLHLRREASGRLELQRLADAMRTPAAAPAAAVSAAPAASAANAAAAAGSAASGAATGSAKAAAAPPWQVQLAQLQLRDAQILWSDATLQPAAEAQLHGIELQLQQLHWPFDADAAVRIEASLRAQGKEQGRLQAEGGFTDRHAKLGAQLSDIDAAIAEPYLRPWLRAQARARLNAAATLDWAGGDAPRLAVGLTSLQVDGFELTEPARRGPGPELQWQRLELRELQADLLQRTVAIGALRLQRPSAALARDAQGRFDAEAWLADRPAAASAAADSADAAAPTAGVSVDAAGAAPVSPWRLTLRELQLDDGKLRLADAALPGGPLQLDGLRVSAQALAWPDTAPVAVQLAARLAAGKNRSAADAARIDWRGKVAAQPLSAQGELRLERVPVHEFEPYFGAALPVSLQRLEAGFKGQLELRQQPQGLQARLRGDALLADLQLMARDTPPTELLTWNALQLNGLTLALQPAAKPRIEIAQVNLADFFARLEVNEQGRLNLQTLAAAPGGAGATAAPAAAASSTASAPTAAPAPAAPAAPAAAASAAAGDNVLSRLPVELLVESAQFSNGRVDFSDHFVRPNYRADLTELNGHLGRLDSGSRDMAEVQLRGRVAGTGSLEIDGAVNPTVIPPALDLKARATDIELPGLTPYSAKYAGYPIERGKLSMNVAYKVQADGKLEANNQIIVNQLTFGAKTDSPDATKLPVPLLVALLQDSNGVIDLDLPLSGTLSDPQFNLGALIWKVITNLFTKAASSPFAVLEGGSGKDLSRVEFRPGTAVATAAGEEVMAKVAKALAGRPQLKLGVVAMADPAREAEAMREAAFEARLRDEQRRERARGALGRDALDAPLPPLDDAQRARLVRRIYADTKLPDKPRNFIGLAKDIPLAEMQARLMAAMPIDDAAAQALAQQRGRTVRDALIAKGLDSARLFVGEPKLHQDKADNAAWVPQAQLTLTVK